MTTLGKDLRTHLLTDASLVALVGQRVHQNRAPAQYLGPYVWFARRGVDWEDCLDDDAGEDPFRQFIDVECLAMDLDDTEAMADCIRSLHGYHGSLGAGSLQGLWVLDQDDDYIPRGHGSDDARHVAALQLEIAGYTR